MHVTGLFVHPVKSCGAVALDRATLGPYGLVGDREWLVVGADGVQLTQRELPAMALVRPGNGPGGGLVLRAPGAAEVAVARPARTTRTAEVWGRRVAVADAGEAAGAWFSEVLGTSARLVAIAEGYERPVDPRRDRHGRQVSFADGYPLLLCTEASLAELNHLATEPVPMDRFRPNLVVDGGAAWEDDEWGQLEVGGARLDAVAGCPRCPIPQIDQRTALRHREPARVLAANRRGADGRPYFGQNLVHVDIGAEISVGDEVRVLSRR